MRKLLIILMLLNGVCFAEIETYYEDFSVGIGRFTQTYGLGDEKFVWDGASQNLQFEFRRTQHGDAYPDMRFSDVGLLLDLEVDNFSYGLSFILDDWSETHYGNSAHMGFLCGSLEFPERSLAASFRYGSGRGVCFDHDEDTTKLRKGVFYRFECDYLAQTRTFYVTLYDMDNGEKIGTLTRYIDVASLPPIFGFGFCAEPNPGGLYYWIRGYLDDVWVIPDPYDWYTYPANGHQYALTLQHSNWADAEAEAVAAGGHLVTINDEAESNWLLDTSSNPFGSQYARDYHGGSNWNLIWIGLEHIDGDKMLPTSWAWQNGEPITFWNIDSYLYTYDNGNHMYMSGPFHPTIPGQWNCEIYQDTVPSRYLRGIIEYVPQFLIKTPNGGQNLPHFSTYMITWETYSKIPVVDVLLEYSRDNGQAWDSIGVVENTGSYEWEVPDANSDQCLVRVSNSQYPFINDTSDNVFTIFECKKVLIGDLNNDCYINFYDIALIALGWLDCGNPFDPSCGL